MAARLSVLLLPRALGGPLRARGVPRDEAGGVGAARGAAGSVAPCTQLLPRLTEELVGAALEPQRSERAARRAALEDVAPVDDLRSTARYRRLVVRNVLRSMLADFAEPEPGQRAR